MGVFVPLSTSHSLGVRKTEQLDSAAAAIPLAASFTAAVQSAKLSQAVRDRPETPLPQQEWKSLSSDIRRTGSSDQESDNNAQDMVHSCAGPCRPVFRVLMTLTEPRFVRLPH